MRERSPFASAPGADPFHGSIQTPALAMSIRAFRSLVALLLVAACGVSARGQTPQQHVHEHGHQVMPFDLSRTLHVFRMTEDGGIEQVVTRTEPPDAVQVRLIQHHLMMEAAAFGKGDFSDPARLHGDAMPGLAELSAGAARTQISFRPLVNGGEIRFHTDDIHLVTAIHRWFGAQLSEHGADAQAR